MGSKLIISDFEWPVTTCNQGQGLLDINHNLPLMRLGFNGRIPLIMVLETSRTRDEIAQAYTHTQRLDMNNAWSEMVSCFPCSAFHCFSPLLWFVQTILDNSYPSLDQRYGLILTLLSLMPLSLYFY